MEPPPHLILSGYHSDGTLGWEFGFEFKKTKGAKTQGGRGGSRGNVCAGDFEKLHVGLEGKEKNVF